MPIEHLLFFMGYGAETKFIAILLGSEVVALPLPLDGQPHPQVAWLMDGRGGGARQLSFDELMLMASQRGGLIPKLDDLPQP